MEKAAAFRAGASGFSEVETELRAFFGRHGGTFAGLRWGSELSGQKKCGPPMTNAIRRPLFPPERRHNDTHSYYLQELF